MMKMLSVIVLGFAGFAIANANETTKVNLKDTESFQVNNEVVLAPDSVKRTMVQPSDLPEAIHTKLGEDEFQGWVILSAYFVEPEEKEAFYEITLQRLEQEELRVVKFDASGRIITE